MDQQIAEQNMVFSNIQEANIRKRLEKIDRLIFDKNKRIFSLANFGKVFYAKSAKSICCKVFVNNYP